jgi:hypothetical protein
MVNRKFGKIVSTVLLALPLGYIILNSYTYQRLRCGRACRDVLHALSLRRGLRIIFISLVRGSLLDAVDFVLIISLLRIRDRLRKMQSRIRAGVVRGVGITLVPLHLSFIIWTPARRILL